MHIVLLGKNGQVGWELQRALAPLGRVTALDRHAVEYCGDLSRPVELARTLRALRPDVIVNAAAYTAVDKAQAEPELATQINATSVAVLAKEAEALKAWLVHYSTDYVFNGSGSIPWQEQDPTAPLNHYGASKLAGEQAIAQYCSRYLIFRTSWVYAARGNNFAKTMLRLGNERTELNVISDQIGAPTGAELIADVTAHTLRQTMQQPALAGLYHLAAKGETSWHDYAVLVFEQARRVGVPLALTQLVPILTTAWPTPAARPLNSRLNCNKLEAAFGLTLPPWQHGVKHTLTDILEQAIEQA
ncbi:dTDP-4-dehydrorhamnose reductase [Oceanisphaera arctica]|uniref:dTDP-4-dehydrorhamnose reductase n=1 Tax=Oceanisphaera arctica TaxID=641510 RepID=A0A2P5TR52_9GAMM|nr:dTDP-4-dehydrorhamnose reductase [Oceanisphaera arctica]PPL18257.1 dTDP-4-dehydrorhamnose reductase [Oceanisphaera arctica]GHA12410.1 NAD(P)-dependent oxidoreductase [Oceanisphaera arctica]